MFENKKAGRLNIHYSRYIATWRNMGGTFFGDHFRNWLVSEGLSDEEAAEVETMALTGASELDMKARKYIHAQRREMKKREENYTIESLVPFGPYRD